MLKDEYYIKECIELAKNGLGKVSPNPMVGCVIVKNDKIVSTGYHTEFGGDHAEVSAVKNAKNKDISGATVYVNLEPCSIYSKTPPCCNLLIEKKVSRVVCGTRDPNPLINGRGIKKLREAGIEVKVGVLERECNSLNEKFFKFMKTGLPFVTLKIAQTLDGKISSGKNDKNGITSLASQKYVHELRSYHDAVLVGSGTVKKDNPLLTLRHTNGKQPYRIILNSNLDINPKSNLLIDEFTEKTIMFVSNESYKNRLGLIQKLIEKGIRVYPQKVGKDGLFDLKEILQMTGMIGISSLLVEGGSKIFTQFIQQRMFDSLLIFIAPKIFGTGIEVLNRESIKKQFDIEFKHFGIELIGEDILFKAKLL